MKATIKLEDGTEVSITLTQDQIDSITPKGRWKPKMGEIYYIPTGTFIEFCIWTWDLGNLMAFKLGNCYQTEKLAYKAVIKQIAIVRVNDRIDELNNGWVANWSNEEQEKYTVDYHLIYWLRVDQLCDSRQASILSYMATEEIAKQIVKDMKTDLDLIFNV